ncbi:MAG: monovalent cation/H+ antiporter subunit A [Novosphingobium sp. 28-62-57]|uniref:monovalent cation/H+ antiporter subunit A n=1 Tax=unclassified Novosphingobium TaxID=2644732 RepID=UPI000BC8B303|nr:MULTISPECIES: monovalent cation/H+ antiporter subunit A [unclassified Novosphingobium]OYW48164.1 MAG: monovalent cation/H+ antiporter subunit A [Novosphingobium sp. 12-63-9]OYZ08918.1 MAG: monovalent cation/H+ antiporter subunit A [Novosphingobium sp. 28-62-57]
MALQLTLYLLVLLPFFAALLIAMVSAKGLAWHSGLAAAGSAVGLVIVLVLAGRVLDGEVLAVSAPWVPALGLDFALMLDPLGLLFALMILGIGLLVVIFGHFYLAPTEATGRFFASLMLFQGAMLGIVISGNILLLLVFWELTSLSSFLLIGFWKHKAEARQGARMALAVTGGGGLVLIAGMVLLGTLAGSFDLMTILQRGDLVQASALYPVMLILILIGCFTKSAQFPFHFWLPHAMAAPTPVSAYLHSATMVKAGVFLLARLWPVLSGTELYTIIVSGTGLITMLFGAWVALFRHDLKSILAYSTISQLGLLVMLLGFSIKLAAVGAVLHIINHAAFKAALFMSAGIVDHETGTRDIRKLGGLVKAMPITALVATLAAASMAGLPPFGGFISKEMMLDETLHIALFGLPWLVPLVATVAATLSVAYSLRFAIHLFFGEPRDVQVHAKAHDPGAGMWASPAFLVVLAVLLGLIPMALAGPLVSAAAGAVLGEVAPPLGLALWHGINPALGMSVAAVVAGTLLLWQHAPLLRAYQSVRHLDAKVLFERVMAFADKRVRKLIVALHRPSLQRMLLAAFAVVVALFIEGAMDGGGSLTGPRVGQPASVVAVIAWGLLIAATIAVVLAQRQRFLVLVYVSVIGLVIALAFVHLSAPDLALTQISVEVVTILLLLLALNLLPKTPPQLSSKGRRLRDGMLALAGGLGVGGAAWAMLTRNANDPISAYHIANSYTGGGGTNIVNVTLVDFRGFDTLGEIIVLGIAGLAIYALLDTATRGAAGARLGTWQEDMPHSPERHPVMFVMATRILLPLVLAVGIYIFLRGHNEPGGGFIAALVIAIAFLLQYLASGFDWTDARRKVGEHLLIGSGVLVALATGLGSLVFGANFLTSAFGYFDIPLVGEVELATAMLFDIGVLAVVFGAVMMALAQLSQIAQRAARAHAASLAAQQEEGQ